MNAKADALRRAEVRYQWAVRCSEQARTRRNELIREAIAAGWTHARIAEATGLSRGRIDQLKSPDGGNPGGTKRRGA